MLCETDTPSEITVEQILEPLAKAALNAYFPKIDKNGHPSLARFFFENGRFPHITDEIKPWNYKGWLIPYIQRAEAHPAVSPRYDYVLRCLEAEKLIDDPLPQIEFVSEFSPATKAGMKMLGKCLENVEYKTGSWNGIRELCEWLGFALGVTGERSKLGEDVQEFLYRNFNLEPLLLFPSDYFGQMLCETSHGKKNGFYPTPMVLVDMMARMVIGDAGETPDRRTATFADPSGCGTGRMLLYGSNYSMRLYGMDIDYLCVLITKINLALYAPWFYIPESFFPAKEEIKVIIPEKEIEIVKDIQKPQNAALFDLSNFQSEKPKTKKSGKKIYTTEIEQPSLFDFD